MGPITAWKKPTGERAKVVSDILHGMMFVKPPARAQLAGPGRARLIYTVDWVNSLSLRISVTTTRGKGSV